MSGPRIVIVGASLAGATAAATLRDDGFDGEIRLIGAEAQLPYNRPPLSKGYLRQEERFEDQLVKPAGYYAAQRIDLTLGGGRLRFTPIRRSSSWRVVNGFFTTGSWWPRADATERCRCPVRTWEASSSCAPSRIATEFAL